MSSYFDNNQEDDDDIKEESSSESSSDISDDEYDNDNDKKIKTNDDDNEDNDINDDDNDDDDNDDDIDSDVDTDDEQVGGDGQDNENEDEDEDEDEETKKRAKKIPAKTVYKKLDIGEDDNSDDDDDGEMYLQKFDKAVNNNYILNNHPESVIQNYDEILSMITVIRDDNGIIIDDLHKTIPYLTKYEKARILGQRAKQINAGAPPFVKVPENVIDGYIIAQLELKEKRIPFIIRRPLPNGGSEYWSLKDLEDISF
jgi:DNA-directed RNA polymerase I, II, and III subunit RPABC2